MKNEISRLIDINRRFGGSLINRGNLEYSTSRMKQTQSIYSRNAHLLRDIISGHPFSNGNKRTATEYVVSDFSRYGYDCDREKFVRGMVRVAKTGVTDVRVIERKLRRWFTKR